MSGKWEVGSPKSGSREVESEEWKVRNGKCKVINYGFESGKIRSEIFGWKFGNKRNNHEVPACRQRQG
jgi:hypothetical protein